MAKQGCGGCLLITFSIRAFFFLIFGFMVRAGLSV